ncbi:GDSL esterase/lipase At3g48460, partial [Linum grandiflorum]
NNGANQEIIIYRAFNTPFSPNHTHSIFVHIPPRSHNHQTKTNKMTLFSLSPLAGAVAAATIITLLLTTAAADNPQSFKKIYAFGDSFTDTGNTRSVGPGGGFGHVSSPPYGFTFFHRPTNRYSDGRLVIDFVTQSLNLPFLPPYMNLVHQQEPKTDVSGDHGVNFAVGGATAINHAFFVRNNLTLDATPQSIQTQMIWFNRFLERRAGCNLTATVETEPKCRAAMEDALFWVGEIGVNDYAYILGSEVSGDTIRKLGISSVTGVIEALLKRGAKYMVVQGLPPSGCLTLALALAPEDDRDELGCVRSANNQTSVHNTVYQAKLQELRTKYPNASIVYLDYWNAYRQIVKSPASYGMKEPFKACCGSGDAPYNFNVFATCGTPGAEKPCPDPASYINWDGVHLTEGMYRVLADMFVNGSFSSPPFGSLLGRRLG